MEVFEQSADLEERGFFSIPTQHPDLPARPSWLGSVVVPAPVTTH